MAVGRAQTQARFDDAAMLLGDRLSEGTVYHLLAGHGQRLFGDDYFTDLFTASPKGRPPVPARLVAAAVRQVLTRDDDYAAAGKPPCDWDDPAAREALVDALVRDCQAVLGVLHGRELPAPVAEAAQLLALVAGQDVEPGTDGVFRI